MTESQDQDQQPIQAGLKRIRLLRALFKGILIAFLPVVIAISLIGLPERTVMTIGIVVICVGILVEVVIFFSRCPKCRQYFHVRGMGGSLFTRKCLHCGIQLKQHG